MRRRIPLSSQCSASPYWISFADSRYDVFANAITFIDCAGAQSFEAVPAGWEKKGRTTRAPSTRLARHRISRSYIRPGMFPSASPETYWNEENPRTHGGSTMANAGPPVALIALGLILWLAVDATIAGISIQTIGIILFASGVAWLVIELFQSRGVARGRRATVVEEPVMREREVY